ncbi:hypothetical protein Tco_1326859 [Tanacetum coccineum]
MHTRSQTRNLHNQQHQVPPPVVEPFNLEEPLENPPPPPPMADKSLHGAQCSIAPTRSMGKRCDCVQKKGGMTGDENNDEIDLIPTSIVTGGEYASRLQKVEWATERPTIPLPSWTKCSKDCWETNSIVS